jgi:hypothetical protein
MNLKQRRRAAKILNESPGLRPVVDEALAEPFSNAREAASNETGSPEMELPAGCPFTPDEVLSCDFLPYR